MGKAQRELAILEFVCEAGARSTVSSRGQGWPSAAGGTNEFKHYMSIISNHHNLVLYAIALSRIPFTKITEMNGFISNLWRVNCF
ncbi:hypothetical protein B9G39_11920 [Zooshikella ganghwensis]|uniref:Uncharacterized protein n=1 Tax=Zooshikella ganghwensis TaxID=202772 RepID=A0A4P9VN74_9GAMM|nr:hypothetical protein B9G39_11920 [Zooshikella ganghwensis]